MPPGQQRGRAGEAKPKANSAGKKRERKEDREDYESDGGFVNDGIHEGGPKSKKPRIKANKAPDDKGDEHIWEISDKRRVTVEKFNGMVMVNIREYYEKDGQMLPGKKGISLPIPQFNELLSILPEVEAALTAKGETVERPVYEGRPAASKTVAAESAEEQDADEEDVEEKSKARKVKNGKRNIEETSEEDE